MSIWAQVDCRIISPVPVSKDELISVFGKEFDDGEYPDYNDVVFGRMTKEEYKAKHAEWFKRNQAIWAEFRRNEKDYLPTGSEGSLHYKTIRRTARKTEDGRYVYGIGGNLRDWHNENTIINWFRDSFLTLIKKVCSEYDTEEGYHLIDRFYGCVTVSTGIGELGWRYSKEKVTENEHW